MNRPASTFLRSAGRRLPAASALAGLLLAASACGYRIPIPSEELIPCSSGAPTGQVVQQVAIVGITPLSDFAQSGKVQVALLPKDAAGGVLASGYVDVTMSVHRPSGFNIVQDSCKLHENTAGKRLIVALDLDSSGSMKSSDPSELRKSAAKQFVDLLGGDDYIGIFDFGAGTTAPHKYTRVLADFTRDKNAAKNGIDQIRAQGGTPLYGSAIEVMDAFHGRFDASSGIRALVVMSDGRPSNSGGTLETSCKKAQETGITVHTLGFGPAADGSPQSNAGAVAVLRNLASCGGGHYTSVQNAGELSKAFVNIGQAAKSGSVVVTVRFEPVPPSQTTIEGIIAVGNGQQTPVHVPFSFVTP